MYYITQSTIITGPIEFNIGLTNVDTRLKQRCIHLYTSTSTSFVSFQLPHSDSLGINPLGFFMKEVQDAASYKRMLFSVRLQAAG